MPHSDLIRRVHVRLTPAQDIRYFGQTQNDAQSSAKRQDDLDGAAAGGHDWLLELNIGYKGWITNSEGRDGTESSHDDTAHLIVFRTKAAS